MKIKLCLIGALAVAPLFAFAAADETHEFSLIWRGNVFRLKPPEPPTRRIHVAPLRGRVKLTGIAEMPPQKWAVLWIEEPGKPASCVVLGEGGHHGELKVVDIDPRTKQVKVRNAGAEMILTFETFGGGANAPLQAEDNHKPLPTVPPPEAGDP